MEHAIRASLSGQTLTRNVSDADSKGLEKSRLASVRSEMASFECNGVKGRVLQLVYDYLLTIPPASVEAERSAAGLLCTKIRSRLRDKSLDALCFIHSYYNYNGKNEEFFTSLTVYSYFPVWTLVWSEESGVSGLFFVIHSLSLM